MADTDTARSRLVEIVKRRSFSTGPDVKLVSGRSSTFYFDMKPTMLHPEGAHLIATLILDALAGAEVDLVGGLEMGAVPLVVAVAAASYAKGRPLPAVFVRKQAKDHGARKLVEGFAPGETLRGKRIAVLEDVTTTGGSATKAIEALRGEGAVIDRVITVVDRLEGAAANFKAAGILFTAILTAADFR
jgi:orotate phosphoribosyltransferase